MGFSESFLHRLKTAPEAEFYLKEKLGRIGSDLKSPFRSDKSAGSFSVTRLKGGLWLWQDFASGEKGDVIAFCQNAEGLTFPEAVKFLASRFNVPLEYDGDAQKPTQNTRKRTTPTQETQNRENTSGALLRPQEENSGNNTEELSEEVLEYFKTIYESSSTLQAPEICLCAEYLKSRGLLESADLLGIRAITGKRFRLIPVPKGVKMSLPSLWARKVESFLIYPTQKRHPKTGKFEDYAFRFRLPMSKREAEERELRTAHFAGPIKSETWPALPETELPEAIYLCEGESDALATFSMLENKGIALATVGASRALSPTGETIRTAKAGGVQRFVICAQADNPSKTWAKKASSTLSASGFAVQTVTPPEPFKDWADFWEETRTTGKPEELGTIKAEGLQKVFLEEQQGLANLPLTNFNRLSSYVEIFRRSTLAILAGSPGSAKSWLLLDFIFDLHAQGVSWQWILTEDTKTEFLRRILARLSNDWSATESNQEGAAHRETLRKQYQGQLAIFERKIIDNPRFTKGEVHPDYILSQVKKALETSRVCVLDCFSGIDFPPQNQWHEQGLFVKDFLKIAEESKGTIFLVCHVVKNAKNLDAQSAIQGASELSRLAHTALLLESFIEPQERKVLTSNGIVERQITHSLTLAKVRNGCGGGKKIALQIGSAGPVFYEAGTLLPGNDKARNKSSAKSEKS